MLRTGVSSTRPFVVSTLSRPEANHVEPTHWILAGLIDVAIAVPVVGFIVMARILREDEAIDAATFLALRDLRDRFERSK